MGSVWLKDGAIKITAGGSVIICNECPCVTRECSHCDSGTAPATIRVIVDDFGNWNGTYDVPFLRGDYDHPSDTSSVDNSCCYGLMFNLPAPCSSLPIGVVRVTLTPNYIWVELFELNEDDAEKTVCFDETFTFPRWFGGWRLARTTPLDCSTYDNTDIPANSASSGTSPCGGDFLSSSVSATSL